MLSAATFPDDDEPLDAHLTPEDRTALASRARRRDATSSEYLALHSRWRARNAEVLRLRQENNALMHQNRRAMRELKEIREGAMAAVGEGSEAAVAEATEKLTKQVHRNSIIRNIFQVDPVPPQSFAKLALRSSSDPLEPRTSRH